jgi:hypothetical protein
MNAQLILAMVAGTALAVAPAGAQTLQRRAVMTGGGNAAYGRCTGEVIVDGAAEIDLRGDMATLRDLSGRSPEWRSFECTSALPANAANIRFNGEGRGTERMIRNPYNNNGVAVVRIEDPDPGANVYRFEVSWSNPYPAGNPYPAATVPPVVGRFGTDQAVQVCQDEVRQQAMQSGARDVFFRRTNMDDNPGRNDWVVGTVEIRRPNGVEERHRFSCSVNFQNGRVRSANIEGLEGYGGAERDMSAREMETCQQAIGDRMRSQGYNRLEFGQMNVGSRYGNDLITGTVSVRSFYRPESFDFSCSVNPNNGYVRSTDVRRR